MLIDNAIHKVGRIDQIVRDYLNQNPSIKEVPAKDAMQLFLIEAFSTKTILEKINCLYGGTVMLDGIQLKGIGNLKKLFIEFVCK